MDCGRNEGVSLFPYEQQGKGGFFPLWLVLYRRIQCGNHQALNGSKSCLNCPGKTAMLRQAPRLPIHRGGKGNEAEFHAEEAGQLKTFCLQSGLDYEKMGGADSAMCPCSRWWRKGRTVKCIVTISTNVIIAHGNFWRAFDWMKKSWWTGRKIRRRWRALLTLSGSLYRKPCTAEK